MRERLQKILAQAGICSRRSAEKLILEGVVTVNGKTVKLGDQADIFEDHVKVRGKLIPRPERKAYYLFYKPKGVVTTRDDPEGRPTVVEFFHNFPERLFPVGRLDMDTEGLIIMTNDGELANALMHPRQEIPKRYRVKTKGVPPERSLDLLRRGIRLEDGRTAPAHVELVETTRTNAWFDVIIHEGRYRQVRRMFDHIHHSVVKLRRTGYAFLGVGTLNPTGYRVLTESEVQRLKDMGLGQLPTAKIKTGPARPKRPTNDTGKTTRFPSRFKKRTRKGS